jgi:hypoxanthine-DNA glycosylase
MNTEDIHLKKSFDPISNEKSSILILGSMPGDKSLELREYYGHARNRFWKIIAAITNSEIPVRYEDKINLLLKNDIAVWDVILEASRAGSLDTAIKNEKVNAVDVFIKNHKHLQTVCFNGKKAEALYKKYFAFEAGIRYLTLPSSSPANAGIGLDSIQNLWKKILE